MKEQQESWHALTAEAVISRLMSSEKEGLSNREVFLRFQKFGPNQLPEPAPRPLVRIVLEQFTTPLMLLMIGASVLSAFLRETFDVAVLIITITGNALIGFFEEYKADRTLHALQNLLHPSARVLRNGQESIISSTEVVPGDILILRAGDQIIADARLLTCVGCETVEASLTGESMPVSKILPVLTKTCPLADRQNMLFAGTTLSSGRCSAIVVATGSDTIFGNLASEVVEAESPLTPLQTELAKLAKLVSILAVVLIVAVIFIGLVRGYDVFSMLRLGVAVAVSAVPEGMAISVTVMLALSMRRMLKQKALVRKLVATETLGSVSVICADKTGTMTTGEMSLETMYLANGSPDSRPFLPGIQNREAQRQLAEAIVLCNDITEGAGGKLLGSSTERGLYLGALDIGIKVGQVRADNPRILERPFNREQKWMMTYHLNKNNTSRLVVKGAPEVVIKACTHVFVRGEKTVWSDSEKTEAIRLSSEMTAQGLRVLGVAEKLYESADKLLRLPTSLSEMIFLGSVGLRDPIRPEAHDHILTAQEAGVQTVMVTGDHPDTAEHIARTVGLISKNSKIVTGQELDSWTNNQWKTEVPNISVYARVSPHHKIRLIEAWQDIGAVVAMTGDGVNDAAALKKADIGIALGSGTEIAKEASDIVLLDNNLGTITSAIEEGRAVFENIRKTVIYLLSGSMTEIVLICGSLIAGLPLPLLATQILWINLVVDGLPSLALAVEPQEHDLMSFPPRSRHEPVVSKSAVGMIAGMVLFGDFLLLILFILLLRSSGDLIWSRTMIFAAVAFSSLICIFSIRSFRQSLFRLNPFSNRYLIGSVILSFGLMLVVLENSFLREVFSISRLTLSDWGLLAMISILRLLLLEIMKYLFFRRKINAI